ncbi:UDP-glucose/GDP-mannose dehydrogenase family protein [Jiella sp. M17.18]|uniref:UDP-glucose dehydrogenase family protein n=1 Tax=Jiella sp. M17.18 TaxID=3234247 RepID=UPI0034DE87E0
MMNVCVVGTGYVGLVTGACLADLGHDVTCVDTDRRKIDTLLAGEIPIYEPGLEKVVRSNVAAGRLGFTSDLRLAIGAEELALFIAVGTPTGEDGSADLTALLAAAQEAAVLRSEARSDGFLILVVKSTVPVGTCRRVQALVERHLPASRFAVVSNPEFLREGCAITDFMQPDRIVVGCTSSRALMAMRRLYAPLTANGYALLEVSAIETSEMIKYASNIFLATKIGLINEFARLCETLGADVEELSRGIGMDHRIGAHSLKAGPGFGGSCFPKDLRALVGLASERNSPMLIAEAVIASNVEQKRAMARKVIDLMGGDVQNARIALLGLSFKAGTDDVREAPALTLLALLQAAGARIVAYDPAAIANAAQLFPDVAYAGSAEEAIRGADAVVVATEWKDFREIDWRALGARMPRPLVVDLRNLLDGDAITGLGYDYAALGRGAAADAPRSLPGMDAEATGSTAAAGA